MTIRDMRVVLPLCGLLATALSVGCEDAGAASRAEVQVKLERASQTFREASISDEGEKQAKLNRLVSELSPVTDGAPGQQAVRGLLMADALRELALMNLRDAERMESERRHQRQIARTALAGMLRLQESASALADADTQALRAAFQQERQEVQAGLDRLRAQVADLESPIAELTGQNTLDSEEVARLRNDADELLRRAMDLGHADGFESHEASIALRRQADKIEQRMAYRQIELSLELAPERDLAQRQVGSLDSLLDSVDAMLRELDAFDQAYASSGDSLREMASELRQRVDEIVRTLHQSASADLEPLYEQASSHLDRAASQARQAAGRARAEASIVRMAEARSQEFLGRTYWTQARGLADQIDLLTFIAASGPAFGDVAAVAEQLQAATARQTELKELARSAYEAALNAAEQVRGVEGVEGYKFTLQQSIALLAGVDFVMPDMPDMPDFEMPDFEMPDVEMPDFDPSMLEGMTGTLDTQTLLAMVDEIDFETFKEMAAQMGAADPAMLEMMREPFSRARAAVRERVERGEITNAMELQMALMEEMMKEMGMGGF